MLGNNPADRENIAASAVFAVVDPETGGGQVNAVGIVPLLNNTNNPALSGVAPLAAGATGQTGDKLPPTARGQPARYRLDRDKPRSVHDGLGQE